MLAVLSKPVGILLIVGGVTWFVGESYASSRARASQHATARPNTTLSKAGPWACMLAGTVVLVTGGTKKNAPKRCGPVDYGPVDWPKLKKLQEVYEDLRAQNQAFHERARRGALDERQAKEHAWRAAHDYLVARLQCPAEWAYHLEEKNESEDSAITELFSFLEHLEDPLALMHAVKLGMKLEEYVECKSAHEWLQHHQSQH